MKLHNRKLQSEEEESPVTTSSEASHLSNFQVPLLPSPGAPISTKPVGPMSSFDSSMTLTLLFLFTVLLFLGFFSIYIPCFSRESSAEISRRRRRLQQQRASSKARSLPLFVYDGSEKAEPIDCAICLSEFEAKETVRMIPYCGHFFHQQCIDAWFFSKVSCPLCRSTQLFRLSSAKSEGLDRGVGESLGRSTVGSEEALTERERQMVLGVRRTSSCSSFTEREYSLRRTSSF